jgi:hypothetical protein
VAVQASQRTLDQTIQRGHRAKIKAPTLRTDAWWRAPLTTAIGLLLFVGYGTWTAFRGVHYWAPPNYISPFYSPCVATVCGHHANLEIWPSWYAWSPAILVLPFPMGFRLTCYYYRKAYYRSFWLAPPACAVAEPHKTYTGETRFPLILQNIHRYFFYFAVIFAAVLTWDAIDAFHWPRGWGHMGLGSLMLVINAVLIWGYTLSCHSCRHICGGNVDAFATARVRFKLWKVLTRLNRNHMEWAWASLIWIALTDLYIWLVSTGTVADPRFF